MVFVERPLALPDLLKIFTLSRTIHKFKIMSKDKQHFVEACQPPDPIPQTDHKVCSFQFRQLYKLSILWFPGLAHGGAVAAQYSAIMDFWRHLEKMYSWMSEKRNVQNIGKVVSCSHLNK